MFRGKGKCRIKTEAREGNERASVEVGGHREKVWREEMEAKSEF